MKPFDLSEQSTDTSLGSERLQAFLKAMYEAFVPSSGECISLQGELVRASDRLWSECLRNGMCNYYVGDESVAQNYYGDLVLLIIGTLTENKNIALSADDLSFFLETRQRLDADRVRQLRLRDLEQKETALSDAESQALEDLSSSGRVDRIDWEAFCARADRCIANWCIANPELVNRSGKPVVERGGLRNVSSIFSPPPPPQTCVLCGGRGFIQSETPSGFPKRCTCRP
jgi:hypothetical protein